MYIQLLHVTSSTYNRQTYMQVMQKSVGEYVCMFFTRCSQLQPGRMYFCDTQCIFIYHLLLICHLLSFLLPVALLEQFDYHTLQKLKGGDHSKIGVKPLPQGALFLKE